VRNDGLRLGVGNALLAKRRADDGDQGKEWHPSPFHLFLSFEWGAHVSPCHVEARKGAKTSQARQPVSSVRFRP